MVVNNELKNVKHGHNIILINFSSNTTKKLTKHLHKQVKIPTFNIRISLTMIDSLNKKILSQKVSIFVIFQA